jgi:hypothetical protein
MAKAIVLQCDKCGVWDSAENPVRTVGVAGPKFDLCATHRIRLIVAQGVHEQKAQAYVDAFDGRETVRGSTLSLNGKAVKEQLRRNADEAAPEGNENGEPDNIEEAGEPVAGEPETESARSDTDDEGRMPEADLDGAGEAYTDQVLADIAEGAHTGPDGQESAPRGRRRGAARKG